MQQCPPVMWISLEPARCPLSHRCRAPPSHTSRPATTSQRHDCGAAGEDRHRCRHRSASSPAWSPGSPLSCVSSGRVPAQQSGVQRVPSAFWRGLVRSHAAAAGLQPRSPWRHPGRQGRTGRDQQEIIRRETPWAEPLIHRFIDAELEVVQFDSPKNIERAMFPRRVPRRAGGVVPAGRRDRAGPAHQSSHPR